MIDDVTKRNLFLSNAVFQRLKNISNAAVVRGHDFVRINSYLGSLRPYFDNFALYCNEYLGADIQQNNLDVNDLMGVADICRKQIDYINDAVKKNIKFDNINIDFASDELMYNLACLLRDINKQSKKQAYLNRYLMRGMLEAAAVIVLHNKQNSGNRIMESLSEANVVENICNMLAKNNIVLNEDDEDNLMEALCIGCENLCFSQKSLTSSLVKEEIAKSIGEYLKIDNNILQLSVGRQKDALALIIAKSRNERAENNMAFVNLSLFAQNVAAVPHESAEQMIYLNQFDKNIVVSENKWNSKVEIPSYLKPYINDEDFKKVSAEMKFWEDYEEQSVAFDKKILVEYVGKLHLRQLNNLYDKFEYYDELFDKIKADIDDEDYIVHKTLSDKDDVLNFAEDIVQAAKYSQKYLSLELNNTGVNQETLDVLRQKSEWKEQDINLLREFFAEVSQKFEENEDVIKTFVDVDYDEAISVITNLPHGKEKADALECVKKVLNLTFEGLEDELISACDDISGYIVKTDSADELFKDTLQDGINLYPDLKNEDVEVLFQSLRNGVMVAYIVPIYNQLLKEDDASDIVTAFVGNFDTFNDETKNFINSLTKFYISKIMPFHEKKAFEGDYPQKLQERLDDYMDIEVAMQYVDSQSDLITDKITEEKKLLLKYNKYKQLKSKYELPKNFDIMLAAKFYGQKKSRN